MATWRYLADDGVSASFGLAADEYLMQAYAQDPTKPPTLRLYTYRSHCALVGRFQNVEAEIHVAECRRRGVPINRRPTGGGAIIMGEDQLGLSLVASIRHPSIPSHPQEVFETYARPTLSGVRNLGIDAYFRPKNDLEVGGKKIAGLGLYIDEDEILLFHTSILVDLDVRLMLTLLNTPIEKISDKEIASFEERLTTVRRELGREISVSEVRQQIKRGFEGTFGVELVEEPFTQEELLGIRELEQGKYLTSEWVYQRALTPDMIGLSLRKTEAGLLRIHLALAGDVIKGVLISGDFFSTSQTINNLEARLKWSVAEPASIEKAIRETLSQQNHYILGLAPEALAAAIWEAASNAKERALGPK